MENINWLFFDMGGVVLDDSRPEMLRQELALEIAQKYMPHITMAHVREAWMAASGTPGSMRIVALRELCKGLQNLEEVVSEYQEQCKIDYYGLSQVRPEAKNVLESLSQKYELGLMANQGARALELLEEEGVMKYFSHQKMSHHVGLEKPDPNFFLTILADTGARTNESVIIDDNWFRGLYPAKQIGMKTVLFERELIPFPDDSAPEWRVSNLKELLNIF